MSDRYYTDGHVIFERVDDVRGGYTRCVAACLSDQLAKEIVAGLSLRALNARDGGDTLNESLLFCADALPRELRAARLAGITAGSAIKAGLGLEPERVDFERARFGGAVR